MLKETPETLKSSEGDAAPIAVNVDLAVSENPRKTAGTKPSSHRAIRLAGHLLAVAMGLFLGYLILRWLRPDSLPW